MTKLPAFQFYPGDWMKDPALRACSLAARGLWMDLLCLMFESPERGVLPRHFDLSRPKKRKVELKLSKVVGHRADYVRKLVAELEINGVISRRKSDGRLYSRRLVREELHRKKVRERQQKHRASVTPPVTPLSHPSSSSSSSSSSTSSSKLSSYSTDHQDQMLRSDAGDRLDDFKRNVLSRCKDSDGILSTALDIIIERIRQSGVNVTSPKYLEVALDRFDFWQGEDREQLMQRRRRRPN